MGPTVIDWVVWSVGRSVSRSVKLVSSAKTAELIKNAVWVEDLGALREPCIRWESRSPMERGNFEGERESHWSAYCCELCKYVWFAIWVVDLGGPKETRVYSYSPGGTNVHKFNRICQGTLAPPGKYDWVIHLLWWCCLMSNYFDHLFSIIIC